MEIFEIGEGYCDVKPFNTKPDINSMKSGLWGIMDQKTGKIIVEPQFIYEPVYLFDNKMLACKRNNKYGIISFDGKEHLPFEYDSIEKITDNNKNYLICKNEKNGVLNEKLEITVPFIYDNIEKAANSSLDKSKTTLLVLKQENRFELRTTNNELLVPNGMYDKFSNDITDEEILVYKHDRKTNTNLIGVNNYITQKETIKPKYKELELLDTHYYLVYNNDVEAFDIINDKEEFIDTENYYFIYVEKNESNDTHPEYKYRGLNMGDDFCYVYFNILDDNTIEGIEEEINISADDYNYEYNALKTIDEKINEIIEDNNKIDYDYAYLFKNKPKENYVNEMNHLLNVDISYCLEEAGLSDKVIKQITSLFYNEKNKIRFIEYLIGEHPTDEEEILRQAYTACRMPIKVQIPSRDNKFNLTYTEEYELNCIYEDEINTIDQLFKDSDCYFYEDIEKIVSILTRMINNAKYVERKKELVIIKNKLMPNIEAGKGKSIYIHLSNRVVKKYDLTAYNLNRIVGQKCKLALNDGKIVVGYAGYDFIDDEAEDCVCVYEAYKREKGFYLMKRYKINDIGKIDAKLDFEGEIDFIFDV
ncbi:MAG: WG repeat-containing protein [Clostridia bacterium]|nr:WG repeat-containing protein [Clostridia bacterium]